MKVNVLYILLCVIITVSACKNDKPDISKIKVNTRFVNFAKEIFENDTNDFENTWLNIIKEKPYESDIFFNTILGAPPLDSGKIFNEYIKIFTKIHQGTYDTIEKVITPKELENTLKTTLAYYKFYFPIVILPSQVVSFLGPLDGVGYGYEPSKKVMWVGLQTLLGKNYSLYQAPEVQEIYAPYVQERFTKRHLPIMFSEKLLEEDFAFKAGDQTLINQMIEKGKRLYVLSKLCPDNKDHEIFYTNEKKWDWCMANEKFIWDFFIQNELLQTRNPEMLKNYVKEGPITQEFKEVSPGNIGSFCGWQIVKKYMAQHKEISLENLFGLDANTIFQSAKYKP